MKAAIDIGSNTVRMLVGDVCDGEVIPQHYFRKVTRLGGGYDPKTGISAEAGARTLAALVEFSRVVERVHPTSLRVVATEAVRRAVNAQQFVAEIYAQTGFSTEIIDGEDEALLSTAGVLAALRPQPTVALVFDIGGGSSEFIVVINGEGGWQRSYPLGVVSLAETSSPKASIDRIMAELASDLRTVGLTTLLDSKECEIVGTAGTVTSLAALDLAMVEYDWRRINNHLLSYGNLRSLYEQLLPLSIVEREMLPGLEEGRGDLIVHGAAIVLSLMELFHKDALRVSDFGLLEGTLLSIE